MRQTIKHILQALDMTCSGNLILIVGSMLLLSAPSLYMSADVRFEPPFLHFWASMAQSLIFAVAFAVLYRCSGHSRILLAAWLVFTSLLCFIDLWVNHVFYMRISPMMLGLVLQTNVSESDEFLRQYLPTPSAFFIALAITAFDTAMLWAHRRWRTHCPKPSTWRGLAWLAGSAASSAILIFFIVSGLGHKNRAYNTIGMLCDAIVNAEYNRAGELMSLISMTSQAEASRTPDSPHTIVLIIGESHSRLHTSLYGYDMPTTPTLDSLYRDGELIRWDSVYTNYISTILVVREMLSTADFDSGQRYCDAPMLPGVMKTAGYEVAFFDNYSTHHDNTDQFASDNTYITSNDSIRALCFDHTNDRIHPYDITLIKESLNADAANGGTARFIIFHLNGQHVQASARYDHATQTAFYPEMYDHRHNLSQRQKEEIAHYDNATRAVDNCIADIIGHFADDDAIVIYCTDHGEEIHDYRDHYGRTFNVRNPQLDNCLRHIPMAIWASPTFRRLHPSTYSRLCEMSGRRWCNSDMGQLIMTIAALRSPHRIADQDSSLLTR